MSRKGLALRILAGNGTPVTFSDSPDRENASGTWYSYLGRLKRSRYHVVEASYYEGTGYVLVNPTTGEKTPSVGIPVESPSGKRLAATSVDLAAEYNPTAITVWRVTPRRLVLEFNYRFKETEWGPGEPTWHGDNRVTFPKLDMFGKRKGKGELSLQGHKWQSADLAP